MEDIRRSFHNAHCTNRKRKRVGPFYSPVGCELRASNGTTLYSYLEPLVTPRGTRLQTGIPEDLLAKTHDPSAPVVPISPVKLPISEGRDDLDTPPF